MTQCIASAVFDSEAEAERAVSELRSAGVPDSALSIVTHESTATTMSGGNDVFDEGHGNILRGLLGGGALGAGLGVAALAIPGVGPLAAVGAIAATAAPEAMALGAVAGAAVGGFNQILHTHGISEEDASYYGDHIKHGAILVSVDDSADGFDSQLAKDILYRNGGHSSTQAKIAMPFITY